MERELEDTFGLTFGLLSNAANKFGCFEIPNEDFHSSEVPCRSFFALHLMEFYKIGLREVYFYEKYDSL